MKRKIKLNSRVPSSDTDYTRVSLACRGSKVCLAAKNTGMIWWSVIWFQIWMNGAGEETLLVYFLLQATLAQDLGSRSAGKGFQEKPSVRWWRKQREEMRQELERTWRGTQFFFFFFCLTMRASLKYFYKGPKKSQLLQWINFCVWLMGPREKAGLFLERHSWGQVCRGGRLSTRKQRASVQHVGTHTGET